MPRFSLHTLDTLMIIRYSTAGSRERFETYHLWMMHQGYSKKDHTLL
jgi:hypothetical protein